MTKLFTALLAAACIGFGVNNSSAALLTGSYTPAGTTTGTGPYNMTSTDSTFGVLRFVLDTPVKFGDIDNINIDYKANLGGIGGGSPRAAVVLDNNNDNVADASFLIHWGPASFVDLALGTANTGNFIGNNDLGRYDNSGIGGSFYSDYASALAIAGGWNVLRISIILDSFGGNDRNFDINAVNVGAAPVPEPSTYLAGALLALVFGVQGFRTLRNRKTA